MFSALAQPAVALSDHAETRNGAASPISDIGASSALNWAGYVGTGGTYTLVSATWTVPRVANPSINGADATWVGIGGTQSRDLIQAGTEAVPDSDGTISFQAWIETLPEISQAVPLSISPGDALSVSITQEGGDRWLVSFSNATTGQSYRTIVHYQSSLSSAEWIEEVPVEVGGFVGLDDFGTVDFSNGYAIKNGESVTIAQSDAVPFKMDNAQGQIIASPSPLGLDGSSFSVSRTAASAPPQSVNYARMTRLLVGSVVELDQKIQDQQTQLDAQQTEIDDLKAEIQALQTK
jgi:hypothetical protein